MAHYKISNKNSYGFSDHILQSLLLAVVSMVLFSLLAELVIGPLAYRLFVAKGPVSDEIWGTEATWQTPVAESVADMKRYSDFTLITTGTVLNHDKIEDNGTVYYKIPLPSGEQVAARINRKAVQEMGTAGIYRLPVGRWREWEEGVPPSVAALSGTMDTSGYVDMAGSPRPALDEPDYSRTLRRAMEPFVFMGAFLLHRFLGVRQGRFAPALFTKRDPLLPRNDLECWCAAVSAHHFAGPEWEGWPLLTGGHRSPKVKALCRKLMTDWRIFDAHQGIQVVRKLTDRWAGTLETAGAGWEFSSAIRLLLGMYLLKLLDRDSLDQELSRAARVLQRCFSSWEEFLADEEKGILSAWREGERAVPWETLGLRQEAILRLKVQPYSPYFVPWYTDLTWAPDGSTGERTVVREVLEKQYVRR